jgi:RND family efflux transporter MFP subunit
MDQLHKQEDLVEKNGIENNDAENNGAENNGKVKKKGKKKKIIIAIVVIALLLMAALRVIGVMQETAAKYAAELERVTYTPVEALTVSKQDVSTDITLSGKVQADKEAPVMVKTPGKVEAVYVKVGDWVQKDQVLFSLDKSDLMASYNQAEAALKMAQAGYESSMQKYENDLKTLENMRKLYEAGAISQTELEQFEMLASDAVRQTIEGQLAQAQAAFDNVTKTLADMDVKAPISGLVTSLSVSVGSMAANTMPAATIVDMNKVHLTVSVSEKEINNIKQGQEVQITIPSASLQTNGTVEELSLAANQQGKYTVKTTIPNEEQLIKPGMFANLVLSTQVRENVVAVPTDAVVHHDGKDVVFVVEGNKAVEREVTTGLENSSMIEILSGLNEQEVIVVKGQGFLTDGIEIKVVALDGEPVTEAAGGGAE